MLANLKKVVLQSLYASFEAQVLVTSVFRKNFGIIERGRLAPAVQEIIDSGQREDQNSEASVQS